MNKETVKKIRRLNVATHRDLGYFFSSLIIVYCISGLALNHINDFNPDFIIEKSEVTISPSYSQKDVSDKMIRSLGELVSEESYKVYDAPTSDQVKIYYDNASLHVNFSTHKALYERVSRRPVLYQSNVIHRNTVKGWKWISDVFAFMLITISITGLFVLKGKHGITGRGKWLIAAGTLPIIIVLLIHQLA
jgi:hypothetical protein